MTSHLKRINYSLFIYIYYALLLLVVTFRTSEDAPNVVIRFGYLIVFFLPLIYKYQSLFSGCLLCFFTVGTYGFAYNFFPYEMSVYLLITIIAVFLSKSFRTIVPKSLFLYVQLTLLVVVVNIIDSGSPQNIGYSMMTILLFSCLAGNKDIGSNTSFYLMNGFSFASFSLSMIYLLNYKRFLISYNAAESLEGSGWTDPNYLSCVIGMGVLSSLVLVLQHSTKIMKVIWSIVIAISLIVQLLLASRGGLLATLLSMFIVLTMYKISRAYKILIGFAIIGLLAYLYFAGIFELLIYRIGNDDGTGSGRTTIWLSKLVAFLDQGNPLQWLFGMGYLSAFHLCGTPTIPIGFHNDYLAVLCGYGFIGLGLFLYALYYPLRIVSKRDKPIIFSLLIYLALSCFTLEPLTAGRLTFFGFYFLIILYAHQSSLSSKR